MLGRVAGDAALVEEEPVEPAHRGEMPRDAPPPEPAPPQPAQIAGEIGHAHRLEGTALLREESLEPGEVAAVGEQRVPGRAPLDLEAREIVGDQRAGGAGRRGRRDDRVGADTAPTTLRSAETPVARPRVTSGAGVQKNDGPGVGRFVLLGPSPRRPLRTPGA